MTMNEKFLDIKDADFVFLFFWAVNFTGFIYFDIPFACAKEAIVRHNS